MSRVACALVIGAMSLSACDDTRTVFAQPEVRACVPGTTQACLCAGAADGAQACASDGASWLTCECVSASPDAAPDVAPDVATDVASDAAADVPPQAQSYFAVYIQDQWDGINCGSSDASRMSPGADIDAVELLAGTTILGTFEVVRGMSNPAGDTRCSNAFDDPDLAKGPPDATQNWENYFSLYEGWLIGEFTGTAEIQPGDSIKIYELGPSSPLSTEGKDEPYEVYIATGIECVDEPDPTSSCMFQISASALGTATVSVPAF